MLLNLYLNLTLGMIVLVSAKSCSSQSDCLSEGPTSLCVFTSAASANARAQGTCQTPGSTNTIAASSSTVSGTTAPSPVAPSTGVDLKSCGNSTITLQCSFGQVCVEQACVNAGDVAKTFFTPMMIAIFVAGGLVLLCGPILLCFCCKCCCFAGRRIGRGAKKIVAAPFHQRDNQTDNQRPRHEYRPSQPAAQSSSTYYGPSIPPSFSSPSPAKPAMNRGSIVSVQKKGPAPLSSAGYAVPMFHSEERVEYLPVIPSANPDPPKKEEPFEFVPFEQYSAPAAEPIFKNPYAQGPVPVTSHQQQLQTPSNHQYNQGSFQIEPRGSNLHQQQSPVSFNPPAEISFLAGASLGKSLKASNYHDISRESSPMSLHKPVMTPAVGPIGFDKEPPLESGFWGFWDRKGRYHQGYTDANQLIYGGVFDDLCYFHFNTVGDSEPVLVEDSMISGFTPLVEVEVTPAEYQNFDEDLESRHTLSYASQTQGISQIDSGSRPNHLSIPYEPHRERGESMDVLGANSPSLVPSNGRQF